MVTEMHHSAFKITKGSMDIVKLLFRKLGFEVSYAPEPAWALFKQPGNEMRIQIIEVSPGHENQTGKEECHIGLVSEKPIEDIEEIELFALEHNIRFSKDSWSEDEHWFDFPDIFVDFVIEIMDKKLLSQAN